VSTQIDKLRERLAEPLLVTNLVNILYLAGFESSNAALLVQPTGPPQLYTDFRYIEAAEQVAGVEAVLKKRALIRDLARRVGGPMAFEADALRYSQYSVLASAGLELIPTSGLVEGLRAVLVALEPGSGPYR
jgi:Xaa-Pro aminopeptidase